MRDYPHLISYISESAHVDGNTIFGSSLGAIVIRNDPIACSNDAYSIV